jgi:microcystin-dependent protein
MSSPFLAEIRMFGGSFVPPGWAQCNGQTLSTQQNTALFSLIGVTFGGDGKTNFALPDFRGSMPIGQGESPGNGISDRYIGESTGAPDITLLQSEMPSHHHLIDAYTGDPADVNKPSPGVILGAGSAINLYGASSDTTMNPAVLEPAGNSQPHNNLPPYLVVNFMIATTGDYPQRG